jgi:hypothetical protein
MANDVPIDHGREDYATHVRASLTISMHLDPLVALWSGGEAGDLTMSITATDTECGHNSGATSLPLR